MNSRTSSVNAPPSLRHFFTTSLDEQGSVILKIATVVGPPRPPRAPLAGKELTQREVEVLRGMANGRTNREIAADLGLAEMTIKTHAHRLFGKLDVHDRAHAVYLGCRAGLLPEFLPEAAPVDEAVAS